MGTLVQIIYISRTTSAPGRPESGVDPVVARILAKSRANNRNNGLVGVLYFGDGCFFQCLEGESAQIDALYAKLEQDPRHKDLKIISRKSISAPSFQDWSMKYVPVELAMTKLLQSKGMTTFDPYRFDDAMTHDMIELLIRAIEPVPPAAPVVPDAPGPALLPTLATGRSPALKIGLGIVAVLAVVGVLFALFQG